MTHVRKRYKWAMASLLLVGLSLTVLMVVFIAKSDQARADLSQPGLCSDYIGLDTPISDYPSCGPSPDELALPGQFTTWAWLAGLSAACCYISIVVIYRVSLQPFMVKSHSLRSP